MPKGKDYIATTRLTNREGDVLAAEGETCDQVPDKSIGWLSKQKLIIPKSEATGGRSRARRGGD